MIPELWLQELCRKALMFRMEIGKQMLLITVGLRYLLVIINIFLCSMDSE